MMVHPTAERIRRLLLIMSKQRGSRPLPRLMLRVFRLVQYLINLSVKTGIKIFRVIFIQRSTVSTFLFAYIYEVIPRLLSRFFRHLYKLDFKGFGNEIFNILADPLDPTRLPIFMTKLVATLNAFTPIYTSMLDTYIKQEHVPFFSTFLAAFTSAVLNFPSFQAMKLKEDRYYTLDWTLILVTRALDTVVTSNFAKLINPKTKTFKRLDALGDVLIFITSCYFIMDNWFYSPENLSPDYKKWIDQAGTVDPELLRGMRYLNSNEVNYDPQDQDHPHHDHFEKYCAKYGRDPKYGDATKVDKLPCEIFHEFKTKSCIKHVIIRFWSQFKFGFKAYFAINAFFFIFVKTFRTNPIRLLVKTIRSASFLGAYSALQWAVFCFVRNHHPNWLGQRFWDVWGLRAGAAACGTSILLEYPNRRNELSMFVTPKALGTFIDPAPTDRNIKLEIAGFSLSFAVLIAYAKLNPKQLRGLLGKGLSYMVKN